MRPVRCWLDSIARWSSSSSRSPRRFTYELGTMARLADSSVVTQLDNTAVLATIVTNKHKPTDTSDVFVPLTVDFRRKSSAFGRIPTNHMRRDLAPMVEDILTSRAIDRAIRPLLSKSMNETQIVCNLLASDDMIDQTCLLINAVSVILRNSSLVEQSFAATRVARVDGQFISEPSHADISRSDLDVIVSATKDGRILMLEGTAIRVDDSVMVSAISEALMNIEILCGDIEATCSPKSQVMSKEDNERAKIAEPTEQLIQSFLDVLCNSSLDKRERERALAPLRLHPESNAACHLAIRRLAKLHRRRIDGRGLNELRPIACKAGLFDKSLHGCAMFQRGQTQVLCTATIDSLDKYYRQEYKDPGASTRQRNRQKPLIVHYEFPPYATGEIGRTGGGRVDRRELGHGHLAERSLLSIFPQDYPLAVRLLCEVLESNGSSSMASVCAGSMALMDAGIPVVDSGHIAGVAMGMLEGDSDDPMILTDINGMEDFHGDMDFKITGTSDKISALQLDVKLTGGLSLELVSQALMKSQKARSELMNHMSGCIARPRTVKKGCHPVTVDIVIPTIKRSKVFGVGSINLQKLMHSTGASLSQIDDNTFRLFAPNAKRLEEAKAFVDALMAEKAKVQLEFGGVYDVRIVEVRNNGVMVEFHETIPIALLPMSQLDWKQVQHPEVLGFKIGQEIKVKYFGTDPISGNMRISRKILYGYGAPVRSHIKNNENRK